jgi:Tfp pilus assembly protein PilF
LIDRESGDVDAARRDARKALALDPEFAAARALLAELG